MAWSAFSNWAISSRPRAWAAWVRSPEATASEMRTALPSGSVTVRLNSTAPKMLAPHTTSITVRLTQLAWRAADAASRDTAALALLIRSPVCSSNCAGSRSMPCTAWSPAAASRPEVLNVSNPLR